MSSLTIGSTTLQVRAWALAFDLPPRSVCDRLRAGWAPEDAVTAPRFAHHPKDGCPYEFDLDARRFVVEHPNGGTLEEVGDHFGVTRERVRQIEAAALRQFQRRAPHLSGYLEALAAVS